MPKAFKKIMLNGKSGGISLAAAWVRALNDPRILQEKAGFLFKVFSDDDHVMIAVAPTLIQGERTYHYALHLETESAFTLAGDVNAQGVFTILFKPESMEASMEHRLEYIEQFRRFAAFLRQAGYVGPGRMDGVTQGVLNELGLSPAPETLAGLL